MRNDRILTNYKKHCTIQTKVCKTKKECVSLKKDIIKTEIIVKETKVGVMRVGNINYISLTDLAKYQNSSDPSFTVKNYYN